MGEYTTYLVGRTPGLPAGYTLQDMAADDAVMIREEFGGPVDVIGRSTGGSIAQHMAADHPDLVRRLVPHATAHTLGEAASQAQRRTAQLARRREWRAAYAETLGLIVPRHRWFTRAAVWLGSLLLSLGAPQDPADLVVTIEAEDKHDFKERLAEITAPTLVIAGDKDPCYPEVLVRESAAGIPNARLVLYPGMGHAAFGKQFERDVLSFLTKDGGPQMEPRDVIESEPAGWQRLYRIGGMAALTIVLVALLDIILSFLSGEEDIQPGGLTATDWFARFRHSRFLALRDLGLWNIINTTLGVPLSLALYGAHRRTSRGPAALAAALSVAGAAVYTANNQALPMRALSDRYAAASTDTEQAALAAAGQALLAQGEDFTPGSFPGFFLTEAAGIVMGSTMLRGGVFDRPTAWSGLAGAGLLMAFTVVATFVPTAYRRAMVLAMGGGLLSMAWHFLTARRLFQLARAVPAGAAKRP
jgi:hypothetical protein